MNLYLTTRSDLFIVRLICYRKSCLYALFVCLQQNWSDIHGRGWSISQKTTQHCYKVRAVWLYEWSGYSAIGQPRALAAMALWVRIHKLCLTPRKVNCDDKKVIRPQFAQLLLSIPPWPHTVHNNLEYKQVNLLPTHILLNRLFFFSAATWCWTWTIFWKSCGNIWLWWGCSPRGRDTNQTLMIR